MWGGGGRRDADGVGGGVGLIVVYTYSILLSWVYESILLSWRQLVSRMDCCPTNVAFRTCNVYIEHIPQPLHPSMMVISLQTPSFASLPFPFLSRPLPCPSPTSPTTTPPHPSLTVPHPSHLPTLHDADILIRLLARRPRILHLPHHIHALDDLTEDDVFAVQERRRHRRDEELAAVGVGAGVLRTHVRSIPICRRRGCAG